MSKKFLPNPAHTIRSCCVDGIVNRTVIRTKTPPRLPPSTTHLISLYGKERTGVKRNWKGTVLCTLSHPSSPAGSASFWSICRHRKRNRKRKSRIGLDSTRLALAAVPCPVLSCALALRASCAHWNSEPDRPSTFRQCCGPQRGRTTHGVRPVAPSWSARSNLISSCPLLSFSAFPSPRLAPHSAHNTPACQVVYRVPQTPSILVRIRNRSYGSYGRRFAPVRFHHRTATLRLRRRCGSIALQSGFVLPDNVSGCHCACRRHIPWNLLRRRVPHRQGVRVVVRGVLCTVAWLHRQKVPRCLLSGASGERSVVPTFARRPHACFSSILRQSLSPSEPIRSSTRIA